VLMRNMIIIRESFFLKTNFFRVSVCNVRHNPPGQSPLNALESTQNNLEFTIKSVDLDVYMEPFY
jgi:hypothetical protein